MDCSTLPFGRHRGPAKLPRGRTMQHVRRRQGSVPKKPLGTPNVTMGLAPQGLRTMPLYPEWVKVLRRSFVLSWTAGS